MNDQRRLYQFRGFGCNKHTWNIAYERKGDRLQFSVRPGRLHCYKVRKASSAVDWLFCRLAVELHSRLEQAYVDQTFCTVPDLLIAYLEWKLDDGLQQIDVGVLWTENEWLLKIIFKNAGLHKVKLKNLLCKQHQFHLALCLYDWLARERENSNHLTAKIRPSDFYASGRPGVRRRCCLYPLEKAVNSTKSWSNR